MTLYLPISQSVSMMFLVASTKNMLVTTGISTNKHETPLLLRRSHYLKVI